MLTSILCLVLTGDSRDILKHSCKRIFAIVTYFRDFMVYVPEYETATCIAKAHWISLQPPKEQSRIPKFVNSNPKTVIFFFFYFIILRLSLLKHIIIKYNEGAKELLIYTDRPQYNYLYLFSCLYKSKS